MRNWIGGVATLALFFLAEATARADGLGRSGYQTLAAIGIAIVIGGLALSVGVILGGIWLVRRLCRKDAGSQHEDVKPGV